MNDFIECVDRRLSCPASYPLGECRHLIGIVGVIRSFVFLSPNGRHYKSERSVFCALLDEAALAALAVFLRCGETLDHRPRLGPSSNRMTPVLVMCASVSSVLSPNSKLIVKSPTRPPFSA
jgi:hypothetical protein